MIGVRHRSNANHDPNLAVDGVDVLVSRQRFARPQVRFHGVIFASTHLSALPSGHCVGVRGQGLSHVARYVLIGTAHGAAEAHRPHLAASVGDLEGCQVGHRFGTKKYRRQW